MTEFKTQGEILTALRDTNEKVTKWFESILALDFFIRQEETWSASDNMDPPHPFTQTNHQGFKTSAHCPT